MKSFAIQYFEVKEVKKNNYTVKNNYCPQKSLK